MRPIYAVICNLDYIFWEIFVTLLRSSKQIVDYTLENVYTKACAIYSAGFEIIPVSYALR